VFGIRATLDGTNLRPVYQALEIPNPFTNISVNPAPGPVNKSVVGIMDVSNPNPYEIVIKSSAEGSTGMILLPNVTDFDMPPIQVGRLIYAGARIPAKSEGISSVTKEIFIPAELKHEFVQYLIKTQMQAAIPMYLEMKARYAMKINFMFVDVTIEPSSLPPKYCGFYLKPKGLSLQTTSQTVCRDSMDAMLDIMKTVNETGGLDGNIDSLAPPADKLEEMQKKVNTLVGIAQGLCFGIGFLLFCVPCVRLYLFTQRPKGASSSDEKVGTNEANDV